MIGTQRVALSWDEHAGAECLRVTGGGVIGAGAMARLEVVPASAADAAGVVQGLQPLAGRLEVDDEALCFVPRWPFVAGMEYAVLARADSGATEILGRLRRPALDGAATTEVVAIFPTARAVPMNLLKIYVQFSAPMSEGDASRAVRVRRADTGEELADVFLPNSLELWDPERRRLTLLLDPGRIKRGLLPHVQMGYPLSEGVPVVVSIDAGFRDAAGLPLRAGAERRYEVDAAWRARVDPTAWRIDTPAAGTCNALTVTFDRALDSALLKHALTILDGSGAVIDGYGIVGDEERSWRFVPRRQWRSGTYRLEVAGLLEDLAGNSVVRVFDRDVTRVEDEPLRAHGVAVAFECQVRL